MKTQKRNILERALSEVKEVNTLLPEGKSFKEQLRDAFKAGSFYKENLDGYNEDAVFENYYRNNYEKS